MDDSGFSEHSDALLDLSSALVYNRQKSLDNNGHVRGPVIWVILVYIPRR